MNLHNWGSLGSSLVGNTDGRNPANQLRLVVYLFFFTILYITGGFLAGFLNHPQYASLIECLVLYRKVHLLAFFGWIFGAFS